MIAITMEISVVKNFRFERLKTFYYFFYFLPRPSYWISTHDVCLKWDALLNEIMDSGALVSVDRHQATFAIGSGVTLWVRNYPYGYGSPESSPMLPRRITRKRLREYINKKLVEEIEQQVQRDRK